MDRNVCSMVDETWAQTDGTNTSTQFICWKDEREWTKMWRLQNWKKITKHFKMGMFLLWLSNLWWLHEQNKPKRNRNEVRFDKNVKTFQNLCKGLLCLLFLSDGTMSFLPKSDQKINIIIENGLLSILLFTKSTPFGIVFLFFYPPHRRKRRDGFKQKENVSFNVLAIPDRN